MMANSQITIFNFGEILKKNELLYESHDQST